MEVSGWLSAPAMFKEALAITAVWDDNGQITLATLSHVLMSMRVRCFNH